MAIERFAHFELDDDTRQLRLRGREIPLQPRVFDLLLFLVRNRRRVVDKEDLLSAVWPGLIVTDASLQRAVSLARSALRRGGLERAIRTHARRGYRFCIDCDQPDEPQPLPAATAQAQAREQMHQHCWDEALAAWEQADAEQPLDAADLEQWAVAAQCAGNLHAAVSPMERAAEIHCARGDPEACARVSINLARIRLEFLDTPAANGCLRRAAGLLDDLPPSEQHGHLAWSLGRYHLFVGELDAAVEQSRRAVDLGKAVNSLDVSIMGLLYLGLALQARGEVRQGLEMQNEAAASVLAGHVSPLLGGIVYCGLLVGCANRGDWLRAARWSDNFTRWCERTGLKTFAGACLLHRAEVHAVRGELDRARRVLLDGGDTIRASAPWAVGDFHRMLGDLHLARGEFGQAEDAYRSAHEHGCEPQPGYALLLHYRGQSPAAVRSLRRVLESGDWSTGQRAALYRSHLALIAAEAGDLVTAAEALAELDRQADSWQEGAVNAHVALARGELELARGHAEPAIRLFRQAVHTLNTLDSRIDLAGARLRLARALSRAGDEQEAELELSTAERIFRRCEAYWFLRRAAAVRAGLSAGMAGITKSGS